MLQTSQVLSRRLCVSCAAVLPFKDSEGGTWPVELSDFKRSYICRHAPVKKQSRYADRSMGFARQQQCGPAISETAEPRWRRGVPSRGLVVCVFQCFCHSLKSDWTASSMAVTPRFSSASFNSDAAFLSS